MFSLKLDVSRWGDEAVMDDTFLECRVNVRVVPKSPKTSKTLDEEVNVICTDNVSVNKVYDTFENYRVIGKITHWNYDRGFGFVEMCKSDKTNVFSNKTIYDTFNIRSNNLSPDNISANGIHGIYLHISKIYPLDHSLISKGKMISFVFHIDTIKNKPQALCVQFV